MSNDETFTMNAVLMARCDELAEHVARLRQALDKGYDLVMIIRRASDSGDGGIDQLQHINDEANRALSALTVTETPTQSLIHIQAQVEEETIDSCLGEVAESETVRDAHLAIERMPRKYAKGGERWDR